MDDSFETNQIREFIERYRGIDLFSTGAAPIDFHEDLYNVTGSTKDPRKVEGHRGASWTKLLRQYDEFADANCYVTHPAADEGSTHPQFLVGGHMTPNPSGVVELGEVTYLMPLCKWHNNTERNGVPFKHIKTRVLRLTGYMQGDSAITFALRFANDNPFTLLRRDQASGNWTFQGLSNVERESMRNQQLGIMAVGIGSQDYAIFQKHGNSFVIVEFGIANSGANTR